MSPWDRLRAAAVSPAVALEAALGDPGGAQRRLLAALVARHATTEFGRSHRFAEIDGLDAFRAAVPVRPPDAFGEWIARMAAGETGILTVDRPVAYEETGGTSAGAKLLPLTPAALAAFRAAVLPWLGDLARRRPGVTRGPAYVTISPATRSARTTPDGTPIGLSDAAYLGADLAEAFVALLAVPPEVARLADVDDWRRATLARLIEAEDVAFVSVWSPTFFLDLVDALPREAEHLASVLSPPARRRIARALSTSTLDTTTLWPRLDTISCWADGPSAPHARRLADRCPQAWIEPKGLLATESAITLPFGDDDEGRVPALTSAVIEFVDVNGGVHLADELERGATYEVVLTTPGGLWRWAIGDRVVCVGHRGATPRLVFLGRSGLVGDLVGEKLDEAFVAGVLARLDRPAALVAHADPPRWELWIDAIDIDPEAAAREIDAALRADPQWAHARDLGQLPPLVGRSKPGFVAARAEARARAGRRLGVEKPAAIVLDP